MPGKKDTATIVSSWITNPTLYRALTASDADLSFTQTIDLSRSPMGTGNTLVILPVLTSGSGTVQFDVYVNFPNGDPALATSWFLQFNTGAIASNALYQTQTLYGGIYKLKATLSGVANFNIYTMFSDLRV